MEAQTSPTIVNGRCPLCVEAYGTTGKPAHMAEPKCVFWDEGGQFNADNWNCALMAVLRTEAERVWNENPPHAGLALLTADDQRCATITVSHLLADVPDDHDTDFNPDFLVLSWYKQRGRTEGAWLIDQSYLQPLDFERASAIVRAIEARG